jgi:hypothetical protein
MLGPVCMRLYNRYLFDQLRRDIQLVRDMSFAFTPLLI